MTGQSGVKISTLTPYFAMLEAWLIWLLPLVLAFAVPPLIRVSRKMGELLSVLVVGASAVLSLQFVPRVWGGSSIHVAWSWIPLPGGGEVSFGVLLDPLSVIMATIASGIGLLIVIYSIGYMAHEEGAARYFFFITLFIGGMILLVTSSSLLGLYIGWEIVGICSYALIGHYTQRREAREASIKAFVTTRIGDVMLFASILLTFTYLGTMDLTEIQVLITKRAEAGTLDMGLLTLILLLAFGGAIGKSAQFPLHVWLPDAMEGPTPVSALIHAATMVKAGVYLVARYSLTVVPFEHFSPSTLSQWYTAIGLIGGFTALFAASMGLVSNDIKRVIAYSTISQLALMFTALSVGVAAGWFGGVFHVISHSVFKALLFLCSGAVIHYVGTNDMDKMGGLRKRMPITFYTSLIGVLALSGVPPFNGFFSKELIINSLLEVGAFVPLLLVIGASVLTVIYSFRWLAMIFLGEPRMSHNPSHNHHREAPLTMLIPLIALAALTLSAVPPFEETLHKFVGIEEKTQISALTYITSAFIIVAGLATSYVFYLGGAVSPTSVRSIPVLRAGHKVLENRYYIDEIYRKVFVDGVTALSRVVRDRLEIRVIDGLNYASARAFQKIVEAVRYVQTGSSNINISGVAIGLVVLLVFFFARLTGLI